MIEKLVSFETGKLAREKGFDVHICRCGGFPDCICDGTDINPTQSLLQKWLRDTRNIQVYCFSTTKNGEGKYRDYVVHVNENILNDSRDEEYQTYEEALEAGLQFALEMI